VKEIEKGLRGDALAEAGSCAGRDEGGETQVRDLKTALQMAATGRSSMPKAQLATSARRFTLEGEPVAVEAENDDGRANVLERDILRWEGDPAAGGDTVSDMVGMSRSRVAGQRALGLKGIANLAERAEKEADKELWEEVNAFL
jgi:hypothetical protein